MEQDIDTGLILDSPDDDYQGPEIAANTQDNQSTVNNKTKPEDFAGKKPTVNLGNIPGRLKRKLILGVLGTMVMGSVGVMYLNGNVKEVKKNDSEESVFGADAPKFNKNIIEKNTLSGNELTSEELVTEAPPVFVRPATPKQAPQYSGESTSYSGSTSSVREEEVSPLQKEIPGLRLKNQGYSTPSSNTFGKSKMPTSPSGAMDALQSYAAGASMGTQATNYQAQNNQSDKQKFYNQNKDSFLSGDYANDESLWVGTLIPAILINGINTDLPGDILAYVTENVYDSKTGKVLLIPQGTRLFASYNSNVSFAQSRVQVAWNTLTRPDGYEQDLGNMNGVDLQGYSGYTGHMDEHLFKWLQAAAIISAFTVVNSEIANSAATIGNKTLQNVADANQSAINQLGAGIISRALDIQPTITVKPGTAIKIQINKTLSLPAMEGYKVDEKYIRR